MGRYKILVIGGSGFVGSYLKNHFSKGANVYYIYSSNPIEGGIFYNAFKNSLSELRKIEDVNLVINCYRPKQNHSIENVCKATTDLVDFINKKNRWLIHASTISSLYKNRFNDEYSLKKFLINEIIQYYIRPELYTILRFTQIFDYAGLGKSSQPGLYYLVDAIKNNHQIELFHNCRLLQRNYVPIELVIKAVEFCIQNGLKKIHNAIIEKHTKNFEELIRALSNNSGKVKTSIGTRKGLKYFIPPISKQLEEWAVEAKGLSYYFSKL